MTVTISDLTFDAIIGILKKERTTPQRVIVDCMLEYDYRATDHFIDYVEVISLIETTIKEQQFELIEEALLHLEIKICRHYQNISALELKITKPDIISNAAVSVASKAFFKGS